MNFHWKQGEYNPSPFLKAIQIFLLVLIIIGIGLLVAQKLWVPKVVAYLLRTDSVSPINFISQTHSNSTSPVQNTSPLDNNSETSSEFDSPSKVSGIEKSTWVTYENPVHHYLLKYPSENYTLTDNAGIEEDGTYGNFVFSKPDRDSILKLVPIYTPEWNTISDVDAIEEAFAKGGALEVAKVSGEINSNQAGIRTFQFQNGIGYGFDITGSFSEGFSLDQEGGSGGWVVNGTTTIMYFTSGRDIYRVEFLTDSIGGEIMSTLRLSNTP